MSQSAIIRGGKTTVDDFQLHVAREAPDFTESGATTPFGRRSLEKNGFDAPDEINRPDSEAAANKEAAPSSASSAEDSAHGTASQRDDSKSRRSKDLLHAVFSGPKLPETRPVGRHELDVYARLDSDLANPLDKDKIESVIAALSEASDDLLVGVEEAIVEVIDFMGRIASAGVWEGRKSRNEDWTGRLQAKLDDLAGRQKVYVDEKRFKITEPFAYLFEEHEHKASHRGLYWVYCYMSTLISIADVLKDLLKAAILIEGKRQGLRIWWPKFVLHKGPMDSADPNADIDPSTIPGFQAMRSTSVRRNPDRYPPSNTFQVVISRIFDFLSIVTHPRMVFFVKSAVIFGIVSIPMFYKRSAVFCYHEKAIWVLIMVVLTLSQFVVRPRLLSRPSSL